MTHLKQILLIASLTLLTVTPRPTSIVRQEDDESLTSVVATMTLEQKVGQMFMVSLYGEQLTDVGEDLLTTWQPGGVTLFSRNIGSPEAVTTYINDLQQVMQAAGAPPLFVAVDQEGGWIARLRDGFTEWPPLSLVAASGDTELAYEVGAALTAELRAVGVNMNLAPVADMDTYVDNPIIERRSPGSNLALLDTYLRGIIPGMQQNVVAVTKHFPGHGDTREDSHVVLPQITHDLDRLRAVELQPFISAIEANTGGIMMAHIWFSAVDVDGPIPASLSPTFVKNLLRGELGYQGLIMTDAMDMDAIDLLYNDGEAAIRAIEAGVDMLTYGTSMGEQDQVAVMQAVVDAVRSGRISESRIDESVLRVLRAKQANGLDTWEPLDPAQARSRIDVVGTAPLVQRMFEAGITVAFDEQNLVPLDSNNRIGIVYPAQRISINRECGQHSNSVEWLALPDYPSADYVTSLADLAARSDVVVFFSRNIRDNAEMTAVAAALPPERTVAVALRSPYDVLAYPAVSTYVLTYGPQDPAIPAVCNVLFGLAPARGQLVVNLGDLAAMIP